MDERQRLGRWLKRAFLAVVLSAATIWIGDYLVLRVRVATNSNAFGTVTVQPYYAVPQKNHREEYMLSDPEDDTCVNSLLPHLGDDPCWYLRRHKEKRIQM
jgi:hypothetical protein